KKGAVSCPSNPIHPAARRPPPAAASRVRCFVDLRPCPCGEPHAAASSPLPSPSWLLPLLICRLASLADLQSGILRRSASAKGTKGYQARVSRRQQATQRRSRCSRCRQSASAVTASSPHSAGSIRKTNSRHSASILASNSTTW
uniref:Uncharacterized protein n=1 Tax=Triticum urartu TaxID=4572 RepID=A0A8R7K063_TRIUA